MKKLNIIPALLLVVTVPVLIVISIISLASHRGNDVNTSEGASYLDALEKQNVRLVENGLRDHGTSADSSAPGTEETGESQTPEQESDVFKLLEEEGFVGSNQKSYNPYGFDREKAEELAERIEDDELSLTELFKNTLFVGDSIMVGFSDYKLANQGNVIANVGAMLNPHLGDNIQKITDYNPEVLFLHYGLNEMGIEEYFLEKFIKDLTEDVKTLKKNLPYTRIVVVGLWPVKDVAVENQERLSRVPAYNEAIRKLCVELGVAYQESSELFASNPDFYQKDGIHAIRKMYILWICDMIREMGLY